MNKNPYPGKFIVLEGLDGAGKSTQAAQAANYLAGTGKGAYLTSEPSQFLVGGIVRSRLLGEWFCSPECLQLLFAADRDQHLQKEIMPRLKEGSAAVCDRYLMSSVAYGAVDFDAPDSAKGNFDFDWLMRINSRFLVPDLTIYLDVPAEVCVKRIIDNGKSIELFEKAEILEKVALNYKKAMEAYRGEMNIIPIDGDRPPGEVFGDVKILIDNLMQNYADNF